jgi:F-type H+-transporting ATPase subunit gamma
MAKARAIVKRLKAVKNIRKITRTMELIATARFKRAMDRASQAAAYTRKISQIVADLSRAELPISHPLLEPRPDPKASVVLALTSNRGLCGGYNSGVLRRVTARIREARESGESLILEISGKRGINFLKFQGRPGNRTFTHFEDKPTYDEVEELADRYIAGFVSHQFDRLDVAYTKFESASRQVAVIETLLPISTLQTHPKDKQEEPSRAIEYEFLPSAGEILEEIVPAAFKARLFKCFLDAAVSEQIYRRVAMKAATENADDMIGSLSQLYNRARQTQITSELSEIIGGAEALK